MVSFMLKSGVIAFAVAHVSAETGAESWDDAKMSASRTVSGKDIGTMKYFDANYMMGWRTKWKFWKLFGTKRETSELFGAQLIFCCKIMIVYDENFYFY